MNFRRSFITFVTGLVLVIDILNCAHIINISGDNSNDYSVSVLSDDMYYISHGQK